MSLDGRRYLENKRQTFINTSGKIYRLVNVMPRNMPIKII
jgi:hypothetical protein